MNDLKHKNEKEFVDFLVAIVKWRKFVFINVITITIISVIVSFMLDKWYTSTANIIPPKSKGGLLGDIGGFSSTIKDLSKTLGRLGTTSTEAYDYLTILQSRTSYERIITKFNLRDVYEFESDDPIEEIIEELDSNIKFQVEDEGNITIKVTDKDPKRAADMANSFVEVLNEISIELGTFEARNNREFIEKRYLQSLVDLKNSEDSLKIFSENYSIFSLAEQTKAAITAAVELQARIEIGEIELGLIKNNYGSEHPVYVDKLMVLNELKSRLASFNSSNNNILDDSKLSFFTPFSQLPDIGVRYVRYKREYELQTKLLEFILPVYEQAKIEEQKNIPVCLIVDNAVPAQKKSAPKRVYIIIASFLISSLFSVLWVLIVESFNTFKNDEIKYKKYELGVFAPLKSIFGIKNKT